MGLPGARLPALAEGPEHPSTQGAQAHSQGGGGAQPQQSSQESRRAAKGQA